MHTTIHYRVFLIVNTNDSLIVLYMNFQGRTWVTAIELDEMYFGIIKRRKYSFPIHRDPLYFPPILNVKVTLLMLISYKVNAYLLFLEVVI